MKTPSYVFILVTVLSSSLFADQIILKNGDRLSGTIVKSDGKVLVMKSDLAGDLTVKFNDVQSVTSTGDLTVNLGDKIVVGPVTTNGDNLVIATKSGTPVEGPKSSVTLIRSPAEQAAYEKSLHPGFAEGWAGGLNLGFALTRGNSETKNLNIAFGAVRTGFHDKLSLYTNSVYATNDLSTASPHTTANTIGGGVLYNHDFSARTFWFVNADFLSNSLQELNLRSTFGGGLGLHAIKTPVTTLDLLAGLNYTHESYSAYVLQALPPTFVPSRTDSLAGLTLGDTFTHKIGESTDIMQSLFIYPDLSDTSQYRGTFNFGTVTKLNKWLGWQNSFGDIYVSNPPLRTKKNDLQLTTGISISFTH